MKVWIDQYLCTGDGLYAEICPEVFTLLDDGLAYVQDGAAVMAKAKGNPQGIDGSVTVPADKGNLAIEASLDCPGECIFVEAA